MKKLLVTVIGAAAAIGAYAQLPNTYWFEDKARGATDVAALGSSWSEAENSTNTYAIVELERAGQTLDKPAPYNEYNDPTNALSVKTTFGKPLSFKADSDAVGINTGIYFDSLVKFTVCEEAPDQTYDGAKIVMWLQEQSVGDTVTGTNLMVRAGFLSVDNSGVNVVSTNYLCNEVGADFADKWHRVTIKAIADITESGAGVPAFAIYIDGAENKMVALCDDAKWDATFTYGLAEAVTDLGESMLFPSLVQDSEDATKLTLEKASFDGTGFLAELVFTETAPEFAKDFVSDKAGVTINDKTTMYPTLAEAVAAVNEEDSGNVAFTLAKGMTITEPLVFTSGANVVLDFAGFVLTNNAAYAAISNTCNLTIMNSKGVGGIRCTAAGTAVAQGENGSVAITGGNFWGDITNEGLNGDEVQISGGSFQQNAQALGDYLVAGKKLQYNAETGLYDVVNKVYVAQIAGGASYETFKEAVDAANAGDTVTVLADCTVTEAITFTKGITVSNDYTVTVVNNGNITYAYRVINGTTTPVTLCGNGTFTESGTASGSQFLVGFTVTRYETAPTAGSLVLDGCTVTNGQSNVIKVENGTFTMNSGTINAAGLRGVKADGEDAANSATVTINGGTINSTKAAVAVSSKADKGAATATITGGTIVGPVTDEASTVDLSSITIPGTSTARFSAKPTDGFVEADYKTVLSDGWYVVTAKVYYTDIELNTNTLAMVTNTTATLTATTTPATAADDGITWESSDTSVATVAGGVVTAVAAGNATITAKATHDSTVKATCTVTVTAPSPTPSVEPIPADSSTAEVPASEYKDAEAAAKAVPVAQSEASAAKVSDETYQTYFTKTAVLDGDKYVVTAKIKEEIETAIATAAESIVSGSEASGNVTVPAGLYYQITAAADLGDIDKEASVVARDISSGSAVSVAKPGSEGKGFIKVKLGTQSFGDAKVPNND